jgi:hypothetical protein
MPPKKPAAIGLSGKICQEKLTEVAKEHKRIVAIAKKWETDVGSLLDFLIYDAESLEDVQGYAKQFRKKHAFTTRRSWEERGKGSGRR